MTAIEIDKFSPGANIVYVFAQGNGPTNATITLLDGKLSQNPPNSFLFTIHTDKLPPPQSTVDAMATWSAPRYAVFFAANPRTDSLTVTLRDGKIVDAKGSAIVDPFAMSEATARVRVNDAVTANAVSVQPSHVVSVSQREIVPPVPLPAASSSTASTTSESAIPPPPPPGTLAPFPEQPTASSVNKQPAWLVPVAILGGAILLFLIVLLIVFLIRRSETRRKQSANQKESGSQEIAQQGGGQARMQQAAPISIGAESITSETSR